MLATCVKMQDSNSPPQYSLARMRHADPRPPFWVGGEYLELNSEPYLKDALGAYRLEGPALWASLKSGDLVSVLVMDRRPESLICEAAQKVQTAQRERLPAQPEAALFARFTDEVRAFLKSKGLQEIFTPTLVACPGLEPTLEAFATTVTKGKEQRVMYLPTSPEIHLKKAMARGWTDIFEIRPCFRRGEFSEHHENEFTMLEWYRGFSDLDLVIEDLKGMLLALKSWMPKTAEPRETDFAALFKELLNFQLTPSTSRDELWSLAQDLKIDLHESDTFTDIFHRLMIEKIEPAMAVMGPLIVRRFPPEMAALAKLDGEGWADRFEFYWNGLEIANAFFEVTDPAEQNRRWEGEQAERRRLGTGELPQDPGLIEALEMGLPPTGGIALGLERLYMACRGIKDIKKLKIFPPVFD